MAKGSTSQTSTNVPRGGGRGGVPPGASTSTGGTLRRRTGARPAAGGGGMGRVSQSVMNFYTDDSPGIKIPPVLHCFYPRELNSVVQFLVVVLSLGFIGFVTLLHVVGKIRGA